MKKATQKTAKKSAVTPEQLKSAYGIWKKGGISIWGVKKQTGILAKVLLPAFQQMATAAEKKVLKSPAARLPKPEAKAKAKGKESADAPSSRRAA